MLTSDMQLIQESIKARVQRNREIGSAAAGFDNERRSALCQPKTPAVHLDLKEKFMNLRRNQNNTAMLKIDESVQN